MIETAPCKGCADRCTACHASCDKYKEWQERYHAQKKYLEDARNRWKIPMTVSREKAFEKYYPDGSAGHRRGGIL